MITNVDRDHLDTYRDLDDIEDAFVAFASRVPFFGQAIVCLDDPDVQRLLPRLDGRRVVTYGLSPQADLQAPPSRSTRAVRQPLPGAPRRRPTSGRGRGADAGPAQRAQRARRARRRPRPGPRLRRDDAARWPLSAACTAASSASAPGAARPWSTTTRTTRPRWRRRSQAARQAFPGARVHAVFQPHLFSRTRDLAEEFGRALLGADTAVVTDVYPSRELPIPGVTGELVVRGGARLRAPQRRVLRRLARRRGAVLRDLVSEGDVVLTLGAGDINRLAQKLVAETEEGGVSLDLLKEARVLPFRRRRFAARRKRRSLAAVLAGPLPRRGRDGRRAGGPRPLGADLAALRAARRDRRGQPQVSRAWVEEALRPLFGTQPAAPVARRGARAGSPRTPGWARSRRARSCPTACVVSLRERQAVALLRRGAGLFYLDAEGVASRPSIRAAARPISMMVSGAAGAARSTTSAPLAVATRAAPRPAALGGGPLGGRDPRATRTSALHLGRCPSRSWCGPDRWPRAAAASKRCCRRSSGATRASRPRICASRAASSCNPRRPRRPGPGIAAPRRCRRRRRRRAPAPPDREGRNRACRSRSSTSSASTSGRRRWGS